ncbi:hypothetical protein [Arthrobacter sp. JUb115]|uniref:hypothetical protein n=1 Tax=Arthrobacter sp. JUb115 TaxID=2485108 RepID=UPI0010620810|nr:hypothetical protein [Arthrobacter sp. JUb115]
MLAFAGLLLLLDLAMLSYRAIQATTLQEANSLYTNRAIELSGDPSTAIDYARGDGLDVTIFQPLADDDHIRAVFSTTDVSGSLPLHDIRWNVSDSRPGALVGANLQAVGAEIVILGKEYEVAGLLGARDKSLLADEIVIYDPQLFEEPGERRFVVDGPDADRITERFENTRAIESGLSRRTNIDFISPIMNMLTVVLLITGTGILGYLTHTWGAARDSVDRLWGRTRAFLLSRHILSYTTVWIVAAIVPTLILFSAGRASLLFQDFLYSHVLLTSMFILSFTTSFVVRNGGMK